MIPPERIPLQQIAMALVVACVVGFVGFQVVGAATSDEMQAYMEQSEQWCEDRGGELVNVNAVVGGGLHCDLPNGPSVHMNNVIEPNANLVENQTQ